MTRALLGSQSPYLDTRCGVLPGRNEERSIDQWISKSWNNWSVCLSVSLSVTFQRWSFGCCREHRELCSSCELHSWREWSTVSHRSRYCTHLPSDKFGFILTHRNIYFYLNVIRIYLLSWKHVECTVIVSSKENTSPAVVPDGKYQLLFQMETEIFLYATVTLDLLCWEVT